MRWHRIILDEAHQAFTEPLRLGKKKKKKKKKKQQEQEQEQEEEETHSPEKEYILS
jgi:hypothetical protein